MNSIPPTPDTHLPHSEGVAASAAEQTSPRSIDSQSVAGAPERKLNPLPPVTCYPWCTYQDGHAKALHHEDQWCGTPIHEVQTLMYPSIEQSDGSFSAAVVTVYGMSYHHGRASTVHIGLNDDQGFDITIEEARKVAAVIIDATDEMGRVR